MCRIDPRGVTGIYIYPKRSQSHTAAWYSVTAPPKDGGRLTALLDPLSSLRTSPLVAHTRPGVERTDLSCGRRRGEDSPPLNL